MRSNGRTPSQTKTDWRWRENEGTLSLRINNAAQMLTEVDKSIISNFKSKKN